MLNRIISVKWQYLKLFNRVIIGIILQYLESFDYVQMNE